MKNKILEKKKFEAITRLEGERFLAYLKLDKCGNINEHIKLKKKIHDIQCMIKLIQNKKENE